MENNYFALVLKFIVRPVDLLAAQPSPSSLWWGHINHMEHNSFTLVVKFIVTPVDLLVGQPSPSSLWLCHTNIQFLYTGAEVYSNTG